MTEYFSDKFGQTISNRDSAALVEILRRQSALPEYKTYKARSIELLGLHEGSRAIDIGCGLGEEACAMARSVGTFGRIVGFDAASDMIALATRLAPQGLPIEFIVGDARSLPFPNEYFQAARIDRVLQHFADADKFIREASRVLSSGARLVVAEPNWDTFSIEHPDLEATRSLTTLWAKKYKSPNIAQQLPEFLRNAGLQHIQTESFSLNYPDCATLLGIFELERFAMERLSDGLSWISMLKSRRPPGPIASLELRIASGVK